MAYGGIPPNLLRKRGYFGPEMNLGGPFKNGDGKLGPEYKLPNIGNF